MEVALLMALLVIQNVVMIRDPEIEMGKNGILTEGNSPNNYKTPISQKKLEGL